MGWRALSGLSGLALLGMFLGGALPWHLELFAVAELTASAILLAYAVTPHATERALFFRTQGSWPVGGPYAAPRGAQFTVQPAVLFVALIALWCAFVGGLTVVSVLFHPSAPRALSAVAYVAAVTVLFRLCARSVSANQSGPAA